MYDLCIVGAGMVGSAAARHASLNSGLSMCLVGPTEPEKRSARENRDIYGSYYDEGRITRCIDQDIVWACLAKESVKRYRDLEQQSGIKFYYEVGSLMIGGENSVYLQKIEDVTLKEQIPREKLENESLEQRFPFLNIGKDNHGILETENAGYINPRKMVDAQKTMAERQGCTIIDDVVCRVTRIVQSDGSYEMLVETEGGRAIRSKKVLLATGAFTTFRDLLAGIIPHQIITPLIVALVEVDKADLQKLRNMPCIIYKGPANKTWKVLPSHNGQDIAFYMLPPIKYPDGRYYIKLGHNGAVHRVLTSSEDVKRWFDKGDSDIEKSVAKFTTSLFKGLTFPSWTGDRCVITETPTIRPYIDMIHSQLGVAIGGNGYAAKSSDEIGRLAASMILGKWDTKLSRDLFKLRTNSYPNSFTSKKSNL